MRSGVHGGKRTEEELSVHRLLEFVPWEGRHPLQKLNRQLRKEEGSGGREGGREGLRPRALDGRAARCGGRRARARVPRVRPLGRALRLRFCSAAWMLTSIADPLQPPMGWFTMMRAFFIA